MTTVDAKTRKRARAALNRWLDRVAEHTLALDVGETTQLTLTFVAVYDGESDAVASVTVNAYFTEQELV